MNQVLFISAQYVKDYSTFDLNIDEKLLLESISSSMFDHILPIVGTGLFNELIDKVTTNTMTGYNQTLLTTYVQPALAAYTLYEVSDYLLYKFTNKSIEKQKSDNAEPITLNELNHLKGKFLDRAQGKATRLNNYLMANYANFPLYSNPGNSMDTIQPTHSDDYMYGFYTPKRNKRRR